MQSINSPLSNPPVDTIDVLANVNQIVASTDIAVTNGGTGVVAVSDTSTLASVTGRGNTTANIVQFSAGANVTGGVLNVASNTVTGNLSVLQNTSTGNLSVTQNVSGGNLSFANANVSGTLNANNIAVTGQSYIVADFTTWNFEEDFTSYGIVNQVNGSNPLSAEHKWNYTNIGTNANCKIVSATASDGLHMGVIGLNANNTGSGNGVCFFLGGGAASAGYVNPNTQAFVYKTAFQLSTTASVSAFLGFASNNNQTASPNVNNAAMLLGIRYDSSVDTNLMFIGVTTGAAGNTWKDSGVAPGTGWHRLVITGLGNGNVNFNLDGNVTAGVVATVPSGFLDCGVIQLVTRATAAPQLNVDYYSMQATVGAR